MQLFDRQIHDGEARVGQATKEVWGESSQLVVDKRSETVNARGDETDNWAKAVRPSKIPVGKEVRRL